MGKKQDIESLADYIESLLKAGLNAKIDQINTEKADTTTLKHVDAAAYSMHRIKGSALNFDPLVVTYLDNLDAVGMGAGTAETPTIKAVILVADNGQDSELDRRMLRYMRAVKEVFEENFSKNRTWPNLEITSLVPDSAKLNGSSQNYRATGVNLKTSLA